MTKSDDFQKRNLSSVGRIWGPQISKLGDDLTKSDEMLIDFQKRNGGKLGVRRIKSKSIPQILLSLRIEGLRSTYAATRTSRRGVRCSVWFLLVHVVRFPVVASNLSRRPLQITPKPSSFQTKCNFQKEILPRFFFWDGRINVIVNNITEIRYSLIFLRPRVTSYTLKE